LTILDANLTAVEMLFSCFVIRQTRVDRSARRLAFRGLQARSRLVTLDFLIVQAADLANVLETIGHCFERRRKGRIFVAEMSQEF
jgi:hypothetical protein